MSSVFTGGQSYVWWVAHMADLQFLALSEVERISHGPQLPVLSHTGSIDYPV